MESAYPEYMCKDAIAAYHRLGDAEATRRRLLDELKQAEENKRAQGEQLSVLITRRLQSVVELPSAWSIESVERSDSDGHLIASVNLKHACGYDAFYDLYTYNIQLHDGCPTLEAVQAVEQDRTELLRAFRRQGLSHVYWCAED